MGMEGDYGALTGDLWDFSVKKVREASLFCARYYPVRLSYLHDICTLGRNWVDGIDRLGRKRMSLFFIPLFFFIIVQTILSFNVSAYTVKSEGNRIFSLIFN